MKRNLFAIFLALALVVALAFVVAPTAQAATVLTPANASDGKITVSTAGQILDLQGENLAVTLENGVELSVIDTTIRQNADGSNNAGTLTVTGDGSIADMSVDPTSKMRFLAVDNGSTYSFYPFNMTVSLQGINTLAKNPDEDKKEEIEPAAALRVSFVAFKPVIEKIEEYGFIVDGQKYSKTKEDFDSNIVHAYANLLGSLRDDKIDVAKSVQAYVTINKVDYTSAERSFTPREILKGINKDANINPNEAQMGRIETLFNAEEGYARVKNILTRFTGATCVHRGGTATCVQGATCLDCDTPYGEKDEHNHNFSNSVNCLNNCGAKHGYIKVTNSAQVTTGNYVMIVNGYAPTHYDNNWVLVESLVTSGDITETAGNGLAWTITVTDTGVKLTDKNNVSIAPKSGTDNGIKADSYSWTLVPNDDGTFTFKGYNGAVILASNSTKTSGENKIRAYKSATVNGAPSTYHTAFALYKLCTIEPCNGNHIGGEATCVTPGYCTNCGEEYIPATGNHADNDDNHICDTCTQVMSNCEDDPNDKDHKCDHSGCGKVLDEKCIFEDHTCTVCEVTIECGEITNDEGGCIACGKKAEQSGPKEIIFNLGANGSASHNDGTSKTTYTETVDGYTLSITNGTQFYTGARDAKGNSCLKLGSSKNAGSFKLTVNEDVTKVVIHAAKYKTGTSKYTINGGTASSLTKNSDNGEYDVIEIDTSSNKTITFASASGGLRLMINTILFIVED